MGSGKNPKPISLHILEGNKSKLSKAEIERRQEAEEALDFKSDKIRPPTWLRKEARKYFTRLVKEFEGMDLIKNVDTNALGLYADALLDYITFTDIIEVEGVQIVHVNKAGEANSVPHPLLTRKTQAFQQMSKLMSEFGLTPVARAKLAMSMQVEEKDDSKFGDRL